MADYLPLGTRVVYDRTNVLERANHREMAGYSKAEHIDGKWVTIPNSRDVTSRLVRRWFRSIDVPYRIMTEENTGLVEGVIVGVRTIASGFTQGGWDEPAYFVPIEHHRVYQVAYSLFHKPALLLLDDVRPELSRG